MKATILTTDLVKGLGVVGRVVAGRSQMAVLANVLVEAVKEGVTLTATNLELGMRVVIGGKVTKEGSLTVPAKNFGEFAGSLKGETVDIEVEGEKMTVKSGKFEGTFTGIAASEFPAMPRMTGGEKSKRVKIKREMIEEMAREVAFAAAADESRPVLTGIKVKMEEGKLVVMATDGFRLSRKVIEVSGKGWEDVAEGLILPARTITEVARLIGEGSGSGELIMEMLTDSNQVIFGLEKIEAVSRILEGNFPDVKKIIPTEWKTRLTVDREELVRAIRAAAVFAREANNIIKLKIQDARITIYAAASQSGESEMELEADTEGEEATISFNYRYVSDFLTNIEAERIVFEMSGSLAPGVWKPEKDENLVHIIMPVRV